MTPEYFEVEVGDGVATVTIDRADKLNAFTLGMFDDFITLLGQLDADDDVRAMIVTGRGRAFCAGRDVGGGESTFDKTRGPNQSTLTDYRERGGLVTERIFDMNKPLIAAVNGLAIGFGATMTLPMDIRIAADIATFGFTFTRLGLVPEAASSWFLPRLVGIGRAQEWMCSGRTVAAPDALDAGLVRSLHPATDVVAAATLLAREIAEGTAPISVALTRRLMWRMQSASDPAEASRVESRLMFLRGSSADAREGIRAAREKRLPVFPMRLGDAALDGRPATMTQLMGLSVDGAVTSFGRGFS